MGPRREEGVVVAERERAGGAAGLAPPEEGVPARRGRERLVREALGEESAGRTGRWRGGAGRGGVRKTAAGLGPPGGGTEGGAGGVVRMVLRGEGARGRKGRWKEGLEGGAWERERKGRAEKRSRPEAAPNHVLFTAASSAALPGFPGGGRRGPRPAR